MRCLSHACLVDNERAHTYTSHTCIHHTLMHTHAHHTHTQPHTHTHTYVRGVESSSRSSKKDVTVAGYLVEQLSKAIK